MKRMSATAQGVSRRELLAMGAGAVALSATSAACAAEGGAKNKSSPLLGHRRILVKGACIVSMDAKVGDRVKSDLLIDAGKIVAIETKIDAADAFAIDASNMIVIPGFVDAHRHAWEGQLRRIIPNAATLDAYMAATHMQFAKFYRPQDMYVGNLVTALGCIDAGITCVIDNSHNARSAAHSDMAVRALMDSGIRAVHAAGAPVAGDWDKQWPQDLMRLQKTFFTSNDQLVTLGMFAYPVPELWGMARQMGLRIYGELVTQQMGGMLDMLAQKNMVGPDNTFNHCGDLPESTWVNLKKSGAAINVCPRSDSQYALTEGFSAYQTALDHGMQPGFSIDNEASYGGDMFSEMRVAFHLQRAVAANRKFKGDAAAPAPVSVRDVLKCATTNGAACAGLSDKVGRLAPGMQADVVMIRSNDINLYPSNNAIGTVVAAADRSNVDTVIIGGVIRKYHGELVGVNMSDFRKQVDESRAYLFSKANYQPDMFADNFKP